MKKQWVVFALILGISSALPPVLAPAGAAAAPSAHRAKTLQVYSIINQVRSQHHLRKLKINARLAVGADRYSYKMVSLKFFSHIDPSGGELDKRFLATGYVPRGWLWGAGENLLWTGWADVPAQRVVDLWMASPHHRDNILTREWQDMGLGWAEGNPTGSFGSTWTLWMAERVRF